MYCFNAKLTRAFEDAPLSFKVPLHVFLHFCLEAFISRIQPWMFGKFILYEFMVFFMECIVFHIDNLRSAAAASGGKLLQVIEVSAHFPYLFA